MGTASQEDKKLSHFAFESGLRSPSRAHFRHVKTSDHSGAARRRLFRPESQTDNERDGHKHSSKIRTEKKEHLGQFCKGQQSARVRHRAGEGTRARVHDLPAMRMMVQEHQVEHVCCPAYQHLNMGSFLQGVDAPGKSGPNVQALGVYLQQSQFVPLGRTCEVLSNLYDCHVSEATRLELGAASGDRCGGDGRTECVVAEGQSLAARR